MKPGLPFPGFWKEGRYSKVALVLLTLASRLLRYRTLSKQLEFPQESPAVGKERLKPGTSQEELDSQVEISHSSAKLPDHLSEETVGTQ